MAIGIITDGKLFYGKSVLPGSSGIRLFSTTRLSASAARRVLETEVSGIAIEKKMVSEIRRGVNTILRERYDSGGTIRIDDIIEAAKNDDNLSIELIEEAARR